MSNDPDDLLPITGCVRREDARRLAEGRTLVNLDAVDFAPILAALQQAAESASELAEWTADGWIGDAGQDLLSQLASRWLALESALAGVGLTENAAWTFDLDSPAAEQQQAAAFMLRDLLLDMRKGKYGPEGKFDHATLAKRLNQAAKAVHKLNGTAAVVAVPPAASPADLAYHALRVYATEKLKGEERNAVELLCDRNGCLPLSDFALAMEWDCFDKGQWDSLRSRLNKKLQGQGWRLDRLNNRATLRHLGSATKK